MAILVTGATGHVGRHVVRRLVAAGQPVRALTRDVGAAKFPAGVTAFEGDLLQPATLRAALTGVERMYLFPVAETAREVALLAASLGVRRIVVLSSDAVTDGSDPSGHRDVEEAVEAVEAAGVEWTHLRPGEFAVNKLSLWEHSIRTGAVVRSAYPGAMGAPVHEDDVAAVAVAALLEEGHRGAILRISGPRALSQRDQVLAIARGLGRAIAFEEVSPAEARADMLAQGFPADIADYILAHQATWADQPAAVHPTVEQVTGRPAHDLARWAADHLTDFQ
ncbi:NAD(P)H-binding protein [Streptomyces sp. NPDC059076]|uniref:NAD(P)H-binding protein n=1 Tax=unclassified Streptomyces TaxID=2593676 RepID=UPI0036CBE805